MFKEVVNMFTIPLYTFEFKDHQAYKSLIMQQLSSDSLYKISPPYLKMTNGNLHKNPIFKPYYDFFNESLNYVMSDLGYKQDQSITSMWVTKQVENSFHPPHKHGNTFLAGVFYLHGNPLSQGTTFLNPDNVLMIQPNLDHDKKMKINSLYVNNFSEGTLVIFPAWIMHYTQANQSGDSRYIMSFNSMPVGKTVDAIFDRYNYAKADDIELDMNREELSQFVLRHGGKLEDEG